VHDKADVGRIFDDHVSAPFDGEIARDVVDGVVAFDGRGIR